MAFQTMQKRSAPATEPVAERPSAPAAPADYRPDYELNSPVAPERRRPRPAPQLAVAEPLFDLELDLDSSGPSSRLGAGSPERPIDQAALRALDGLDLSSEPVQPQPTDPWRSFAGDSPAHETRNKRWERLIGSAQSTPALRAQSPSPFSLAAAEDGDAEPLIAPSFSPDLSPDLSPAFRAPLHVAQSQDEVMAAPTVIESFRASAPAASFFAAVAPALHESNGDGVVNDGVANNDVFKSRRPLDWRVEVEGEPAPPRHQNPRLETLVRAPQPADATATLADEIDLG